MENKTEQQLELVIKMLKRIETKETRLMEVLGINTKNTLDEETSHYLISHTEIDGVNVVSLLHKDVSILKLQDFLSTVKGDIIITCGDEVLWTIKK